MGGNRRLYYLPLKIKRDEAFSKLEVRDWPNPAAIPLEELSDRLVWVPFDLEKGKARIDEAQFPEAADLSLPVIPPADRLETLPEEIQEDRWGTVLSPNTDEPVVFYPFWLFEKDKPHEARVIVNGYEDRPAAGYVAAEPRAARAQLIFYTVLSLLCFFWGSFYYIEFLGKILGFMAAVGRGLSGSHSLTLTVAIIPALMGILAVCAVSFRLYTQFPGLMKEPVIRASTGRITFPLDLSKGRIISTAGYVVIFAGVFGLVTLFTPEANRPFIVLLTFCDSFVSFAFGILALKLGKAVTRGSPGQSLPGTTGFAAYPLNLVSDMVRAAIVVTLCSVTGQMLAQVLCYSGIWELYQKLLFGDPVNFIGRGAELGAVIGLCISPLAGASRIPLIFGVISSLIGDYFLGDWEGLAITLVVVVVTSFIAVKSSKSGGSTIGEALWRSVRLSWGFCFGVAIGKFLGRMCAVLIFGAYADKLGEILGEVLAAVAGFMSQERAIKKEEILKIVEERRKVKQSSSL